MTPPPLSSPGPDPGIQGDEFQRKPLWIAGSRPGNDMCVITVITGINKNLKQVQVDNTSWYGEGYTPPHPTTSSSQESKPAVTSSRLVSFKSSCRAPS